MNLSSLNSSIIKITSQKVRSLVHLSCWPISLLYKRLLSGMLSTLQVIAERSTRALWSKCSLRAIIYLKEGPASSSRSRNITLKPPLNHCTDQVYWTWSFFQLWLFHSSLWLLVLSLSVHLWMIIQNLPLDKWILISFTSWNKSLLRSSSSGNPGGWNTIENMLLLMKSSIASQYGSQTWSTLRSIIGMLIYMGSCWKWTLLVIK